jgi:hypothetical protein
MYPHGITEQGGRVEVQSIVLIPSVQKASKALWLSNEEYMPRRPAEFDASKSNLKRLASKPLTNQILRSNQPAVL